MPVCSDMQMDLKVTEILTILVQLLQNVHLYFFVKYSRYYAQLLLNERVYTEKCKIKYHSTLDHDVDYYGLYFYFLLLECLYRDRAFLFGETRKGRHPCEKWYVTKHEVLQ